ncbi:MAG TPA: universal stress protein [Tepidisphaeraceae bacterium]|jgi:nucleotide-binding universal stress UspA family protein
MSLDTLAKATQDYLDKERQLAQTLEVLEKPRLREELAQAAERMNQELKASAPSQQREGIRSIFVAVDSSDPARWAVERAIELARDLGAKITLVHVLEVPPILDPAFGFDDTLRRSSLIEAGRETLKKVAELVPPELLADQLLREGIADKQVVFAAEELHADLIVIGTHGRGLIGRFLLGSTAEAVVRHATCPVLTVSHPRQATEAGPAPAAVQIAPAEEAIETV